MAICPILAALILIYKDEGGSGVRNFLRRIWAPYGRLRWYVVALVCMPVVMMVCYVAMRLAGWQLPEWEVAWLNIPFLLLLFLLGAVGEEAGWTGYILEPLKERYGATGAAIIVGLFGAGWHFIALAQGDHVMSWVIWQCLVSLLTRFPAVWLYGLANKSVLVVILFHAMDNVSFAVFPNNGSHYDPAVKSAVLAVIIGIFALLSWNSHRKIRSNFFKLLI